MPARSAGEENPRLEGMYQRGWSVYASRYTFGFMLMLKNVFEHEHEHEHENELTGRGYHGRALRILACGRAGGHRGGRHAARAGGRQYSGVWSLTHTACPASPFQSAYAGLIAGVHRGSGPRLEAIDETAAWLVRPADERMPYAATAGAYRLVPPHYVDYTFEARFEDGAEIPNPVEFSWCSYMASPRDRSIHFIEQNVWTVFTPVVHGEAATVFPAGLDDAHRGPWERRTGEARFREQDGAFQHSFSGRTFDYPMYFGIIHDMVFLLMADHHRDFRFFISPTGAGYSAVPGLASPAWDFAWNVWDARPGETRTLNLRLVWFPPTTHVTVHAWEEWGAFRERFPVVG